MPAKTTKISKPKTEAAPSVAPEELSDFLPNPEVLAQYEKIIPGGAERILELGEQRSHHAQVLAEQQLKMITRNHRIKEGITFILSLGAGILGGALLLRGSELAGLLIILIDAAAIVGVTLYGGKTA